MSKQLTGALVGGGVDANKSGKEWQWVSFYKNNTRCDEQWREMRRKHAAECQNFIADHQIACFEEIKRRLRPETLATALNDAVGLWKQKFSFASDRNSYVDHLSSTFASAVIREEWPGCLASVEKEKKVEEQ